MQHRARPRSLRALTTSALGVAAVLLAAPATDALAQAFPAKPIRFIVPYSAGGAGDILGRLTAARMQDALGSPVVVENRPGAGGNIAAELTAKSAADGYTIVNVATAFTSNVSLQKKLPYDWQKDFTPISLNAVLHSVVVVNPQVPVKTMREFMDNARANPGKLTFGSSGNGSGSHLSVELFKVVSRTNLTHVPYKSTVNALPDLFENRISFLFDFVPVSLEHIRAGKVRPLAVTMRARSPLLPDVPTIREATGLDYEFTNWFGVLGPAGLAPDVLAKLNDAIVRGMNNAEARAELAKRGGDVTTGTPQEFAAYLKQQVDLWARVVREGGLPPID
jgi:tripartite-type tricarboxylate transporter receptor subunit TctC